MIWRYLYIWIQSNKMDKSNASSNYFYHLMLCGAGILFYKDLFISGRNLQCSACSATANKPAVWWQQSISVRCRSLLSSFLIFAESCAGQQLLLHLSPEGSVPQFPRMFLTGVTICKDWVWWEKDAAQNSKASPLLQVQNYYASVLNLDNGGPWSRFKLRSRKTSIKNCHGSGTLHPPEKQLKSNIANLGVMKVLIFQKALPRCWDIGSSCFAVLASNQHGNAESVWVLTLAVGQVVYHHSQWKHREDFLFPQWHCHVSTFD